MPKKVDIQLVFASFFWTYKIKQVNSYCFQNELYVEVVNPNPKCQFQWEINDIAIECKHRCFIPIGISPQGDGLNDTFNLSYFGGGFPSNLQSYGVKAYD